MKIKKYIADSLPEAMKEIKKDFGKEAVILQTKEIKQKKMLGLFHKKKIEVIAAKDSHPVRLQERNKSVPKKDKVVQTSNTRKDSDGNQMILQEIKSLKKLIELETTGKELAVPVEYQPALHLLMEQEVEQTLALEIIQELRGTFNNKEPNQIEIFKALEQLIIEKLKKLSFQGITDDQRIIQFVGPTGVGKTTTIAKVAAQLILKDKKKVAFITTDTYRIAAIEQLKTYARILNVPLEVAYNVDDYKAAIAKLSDYDVILVDTAGRNFRDSKYITQLTNLIDEVPGIFTYLVLAITVKPKDLHDVFEQFKQIPLKEVIFTKVDETTQYGSMLSITLLNNIGIAYLTNGQDVPDDLIKPDPTSIGKLIVGERNE